MFGVVLGMNTQIKTWFQRSSMVVAVLWFGAVCRAAEITRGTWSKTLFGAPMTSLFSNKKTKNRWTVLQSVENTHKRGLECLLMQPLMPCTRPNFDVALFNFRIFLKLGAPTCLEPGASCPPSRQPWLYEFQVCG